MELMGIGSDISKKPLRRGWLLNLRAIAFDDRAKIPGSFLIITVLSLLLFVGALSSFYTQYQTNDDAAMNMYAAGKGLGQPPSEFLLFQHFIIGLALKFLYTHLPAIPWYGALLYGYLVLSSVVIGYVISRLNPRLGGLGFWIVLFILFYLQVIVSLQFTICAGYLGIAGILLLYSTLYKPYASRKANSCFLVIASGLLILAGFIRFYSLLLALFSMAPLYGYALVTRSAITFRRLLPILCSVIITSFLLNWTQLEYYEHSPGWERFYSYNNVRAEFIDRHKIIWDERTQPLFQKIGWSHNDLVMLTSWFYLDPKVYSFQNLVFISQNTSSLPRPPIAWDKVFSDLKQSLSSYGGLGTMLLCVLLLVKGAGITRGFAALALLWYATLYVGINIVERHLPLRVWLVMLLGVFAMELIFWCREAEEVVSQPAGANQHPGRALLSVLVLAFYTACCWAQVTAVGTLSNIHRFGQNRFKVAVARLKPRADQLFVTWGGDFPYQIYQLPTQTEPVAREMQFLGLGVGNHEPFVQNRLKSFGIDDLYQSFYTREDVFLICSEEQKKLLIQYILEHYQVKVEVETIFPGPTFKVRKVRKVI